MAISSFWTTGPYWFISFESCSYPAKRTEPGEKETGLQQWIIRKLFVGYMKSFVVWRCQLDVTVFPRGVLIWFTNPERYSPWNDQKYAPFFNNLNAVYKLALNQRVTTPENLCSLQTSCSSVQFIFIQPKYLTIQEYL